jgi:hypothetical protein
MSLVKAYYTTRASSEAGYTNNGDDFEPIPSIPPIFGGDGSCVGIDPNNGNKVIFAGAPNSLVGTLIRTSDDNGDTLQTPAGDWTSFNINVDPGQGSRIIVIDSNISYIYGTEGLYKSIDGGNTYNIVNSDFASLYASTISFVKLYMTDDQNGLIGFSNPGANPNPQVKLLITADGGITWTDVVGFDTLLSIDQICGVHLSTDGTKMVVVGKSKIYISTDSGVTWSVAQVFSPVSTTIYGTAFDAINDLVMFAMGGNDTIYRTVNGGLNWTLQSSSPGSNSHLFSFYSETEGYTCRRNDSLGVNEILRTFDAGVTWQLADSIGGTALDLQAVFYNCGECPPGYIKNNNVDQCDGKSLGPNLCPPGFVYDVPSGTCIGTQDCPLSEIVFVLDVGGSVLDSEQLQMQQFLQTIVAAPNVQAGLNAGTLRLGFCVFAGFAPAGQFFRLNLTNILYEIDTWLSNFTPVNVNPGGGTNTAAGLSVGVTDILFGPTSNPAANKKIILVTDGFPASLPLGLTTDTFVLSNNNGITNTWTITNDSTPPCDRSQGGLTDCTRCEIYDVTMEMSDYIKNTLGVAFTVAILTGETAVNLNSVLSPAENPSGAPTVEAYLTYRALIIGYLDQMTHMFPPSQNPLSPWYIGNDGYKPPLPIAGGHLSQVGLSNQDTGIPFGRLIYGPQINDNSDITFPTRMSDYSSNSSQLWPALPAIYGTEAAPAISVVSGVFNPYGLWDCNLSGDPPNIYAPMCGLKSDGTNDVYISLFATAADQLAPQIAEGICSNTIEVSCGEGCNVVVVGNNAQCECPKTVYITPCVYNIYDCQDLTTPVYCSKNDLSAYIGADIVVKIEIDSVAVDGCFIVALNDIDYCDPLDVSDVNVSEQFTTCEECAPLAVRLTSCYNEEIYIQVESEVLYNNIGKSVELFEYPGFCWRIDIEPEFPTELVPVTIKKIYDDCDCCKQYSCKS